MYEKEIKEILTQKEIDTFLNDGYSERDLIGLAVCKKMIDMGLTEEEIYKVLYCGLTETLEEYAGADAVKDMKQYTSFQDMIDNGALAPFYNKNKK